ncbi:hypothetical protein NMG60_11015334 [Bertholletia excelsa]
MMTARRLQMCIELLKLVMEFLLVSVEAVFTVMHQTSSQPVFRNSARNFPLSHVGFLQ